MVRKNSKNMFPSVIVKALSVAVMSVFLTIILAIGENAFGVLITSNIVGWGLGIYFSIEYIYGNNLKNKKI